MAETGTEAGAGEVLARHFPELSGEELRVLSAAARLRSYAKGEWIFAEGAPAAHAHWLESGRAELLKGAHSGKSTILHVMGPGHFIDHCFLVARGDAFFSALALEPCRIIEISAKALLAVLGANAPFALRLMRGMAARQRMFINKIAASQGKISVRRRVAGWLLHKVRVENTPELEDGITREVLAGLLGLSRESLCRQLGQFSREGVIRLERKRITVLDLQALRRSLEG
ncbi:MAG: Crp/Fnr family transcriptional regulator [Desulfovibrio sp.]